MFDMTWYDSLIKPFLNPPAWIFTPAWIFLYFTMFLSLVFFTIKRARADKTKGYIYFILQLLVNFLWTPAFFMMKNIPLCLLIIVILDILVVLNIKYFYKVSRTAAFVLIPYFLWLIFATYLNIGILILN